MIRNREWASLLPAISHQPYALIPTEIRFTILGFDDYLGKVDLSSGKVYEERLGPDREIGHVDLKTGRVYLRRFGPDDYVGTVDAQGRLHRHVSIAPDEYIGVVDPFLSFAHSAGAMLLLVLPALDTRTEGEPADKEE